MKLMKHIVRTESRNKTISLCGEVVSENTFSTVCPACVEKLIDKAKTRLAIV